jgi:hypothetical protein
MALKTPSGSNGVRSLRWLCMGLVAIAGIITVRELGGTQTLATYEKLEGAVAQTPAAPEGASAAAMTAQAPAAPAAAAVVAAPAEVAAPAAAVQAPDAAKAEAPVVARAPAACAALPGCGDAGAPSP